MWLPSNNIYYMSQKLTPLPFPTILAASLISFIFMVTALAMNAEFRYDLFINGVNTIANIQSANSGFLQVVMNLFSLLGNPVVIIPLIALEYAFSKRRLRALVHICYFIFITFFMALLKQLFQEPRPVWFNPSIQRFEWFCPADFGNPSGHSFAMLPFYEPFFADILGLGQYAYKLIILLFVASAVCFSRMYLGVHSADQIVLGAFLGIAFLVLYRYCAQKELYRIFSCLIHNYNRCFNWSCTIIAEILCLLLPIIFFLLNSNNRPMEPIYLVGLNEVCSTRYTSVQVQGKMMVSCSLVGIAFGFLYGTMLLQSEDKFTFEYLLGRWQYKSKLTAVLHLGSMVVCAAVPAILLCLVLPMLWKDSIADYLCKTIGITLATMVSVVSGTILAKRYQWIHYDINGAKS